MNGFSIMAETHRKLGNVRKADLYDFLSACDRNDFCDLFDSSAFNEIAKGYMRVTTDKLVSAGVITSDQAESVKSVFSSLFDEMQAREVIR